MEGKKLKEKRGSRQRRRLKWRILGNISFILALSMIVSTIVGYCYFTEVVRKQRISDERSRLLQVSNQLSFMTEDIKRFAESILIDAELQSLLEEKVPDNEFLRQSRYSKVANRLVFYNNLRTYISGSILQMEDGTCYGSSYNAMDTEYIADKLQKEEIVSFAAEDGQVYSDPYYETEGRTNVPYICYQVKMYDKRHFGQLKAVLYLEIRMNYFLEQVRAYGESCDFVCLLGNNQKILYKQDKSGILAKCLGEQKPEEEGIYKAGEGYLICDSIDTAGWKLCALITNQYLLERSRFVLEFFMLSFLASVGLILIFTSRRMENMIRPVTELSEQMEKIEYGKFEPIETVHTGDEIETLYECFRNMLCEIQKGEEARIEYEKQKREMEYDITLSQINPHYIYNVLNTVVYLAAADKNKDVVKIVHSLIYTLHDTLNIGEGSVETTIAKELELTRCYLDIQKYRYPDRFTVEISCQEGLEECLVPKTIIQPLVENAILHGILPTECAGKISVTIYEEKDKLHVRVTDDGAGISKERLEQFERGGEMTAGNKERKHIGISNVRDRIRYLYGEEYGMEIKSAKGKWTSVVLRLPINREESNWKAEQPEKTEKDASGKGTVL